MYRNRLAAELCLDPLEELTVLPGPSDWIQGCGSRKGKEEGEEEKEGWWEVAKNVGWEGV